MNLTLTEDELDFIAAKVAERMAAKMPDAPMTVSQAAECLNISTWNVRSRIAAKSIPTIPGYGRVLIPAAWVAKEMEGLNP